MEYTMIKDILQRRETYEQKPHPYDYEPTVSITQEIIEGRNCYWFTPEDPAPREMTIFLHGGGFAMGSVRTHGRMVSHFARQLGTKILFVDYALAPEHPFPTAINDLIAVYRKTADLHHGYRISHIGDSAGASLIVSGIGEMIKMQLPLPHAVVLISPWIDFECNYPSYGEKGPLDISLDRDTLQLFARAYTGDTPISVSSPNRASLTQFPPVLIMVGTNEILLDDSKFFFNDIKAIQSRSRLSIYDDQPHVWPKKDIHKDAARRALAEIACFIRA
jgi:monoterpene epsilon-lactone hydrolase